MKADACFMSNRQDWETPQWLFDQLNEEFGFTVDVCASEQNHKCDRFYTEEDDGLSKDWTGERVWCNPPYGKSKIPAWAKKCAESNCEVAVMLVPARTDTAWFHEIVISTGAEIRFLRGRLKFVGAQYNAPFPAMVVIFRRERP